MPKGTQLADNQKLSLILVGQNLFFSLALKMGSASWKNTMYYKKRHNVCLFVYLFPRHTRGFASLTLKSLLSPLSFKGGEEYPRA